MRYLKIAFIALFCSLNLLGAYSKEYASTVAVVTDVATYQTIGSDIDNYLASIRQQGKKAILIQDKWQHPDSIRQALKKLYLSDNLEGAVLIGDIPVPMIRDAQHFTTAFKMDQRRDWKDSSIPSDRFYDDFDLLFNYIRQDEDEKLYHYYSLTAQSAQSIACDIYSARIKAPLVPGKNKYELLSEYLQKVVKEKQRKEVLSQVLHFAGHGYNSESFKARMDEAWTLRHQFPFLDTRSESHLDFINFDEDTFVKYRLLAKLSDPELDLAILHHHGSDDTQYLSATPSTSSPQQYIEYTKQFFRSKIRNAKDTTTTKQYYVREYHVPESWVEGAFDPAIAEADSIFSANMDVHIPDTYGRVFNARFIMLDACFTGSFHLNDYISAHYLFNPGRTIAVKANTVNTLQDIWPNQLIGILDEGVCIGNWIKETLTLESHLLGDPTYSFASSSTIDQEIVKEKNNPNYWRKLYTHTNKPDLRALALVFLQKNKAITGEELLGILKRDGDPIVRLEAFTLLKQQKNALLTSALIAGMNDSYELLNRLATLTAAKSGDPALLPVLAKLYFDPATSKRVAFHLRSAFETYPVEVVEAQFAALRKDHPYWPEEKSYTNYLVGLKRSADSKKADFDKLGSSEESAKAKRNTISAQRNAVQADVLESLFRFIQTNEDNELRLFAVETLGWYVYSYKRAEVIAFCNKQLSIEQDAAVKNELQKTINRLQ